MQGGNEKRGERATQTTDDFVLFFDLREITTNPHVSFHSLSDLQFKKEPLVPIGCVATAYFLASGIKSFQKQDPRRAQKMMRLRVGAQFATLGMFMYYIGLDRINLEVA